MSDDGKLARLDHSGIQPGARIDTTSGRTAEHFRPDIEGLRGVAVMLVVGWWWSVRRLTRRLVH